MGRPARGVRGMDLAEGDYLVGVEVVEKDGLILSISENGYGKRTPLEDYRLTRRGGKGVINMKTTNKTGKVVGDSFGEGRFRPDDRHQGRQDHPHRIGDIRQAGRSTQGVRLVRMEGRQGRRSVVIPDTEGPSSKRPGIAPAIA